MRILVDISYDGARTIILVVGLEHALLEGLAALRDDNQRTARCVDTQSEVSFQGCLTSWGR